MSTNPHHWPRRHYIEPRDRVGVAVEPAGHTEDGQPLYDFYLSTTQETRRLTEAEVQEELDRLASGYQGRFLILEGETMSNTKRRGNSEGSIYQRSDGRWTASVSLGYSQDGKRKRKVVYGTTKKEVQDKLSNLQGEKTTGKLTVNTSTATVEDYLMHWLKTCSPEGRGQSSHERNEQHCRIHWIPRIGNVKLVKLNATHLRAVQDEMKAAGLSDRSRQYAHDVFRMALDEAVEDGLLPINPCCRKGLRPKIKKRKREIKFLTPQQVKRFLEHIREDRLYALYVSAVTTGARQGELFALSWADIDLEGRTMSINRSLEHFGSGQTRLKAPKTESSRRLVDLPKVAVDALIEHAEKNGKENDFVFHATNGAPLRSRNELRRFKRMLKEAGLSTIAWHDLRHTAASLALSQNVHPKIVQQMLGHSKIQTTLDTYSHLMPTMGAAATDAIAAAIADA